MEPAKDLTIPCLSMKDSACIQSQLVCDLNEQGTAAAMRPVFRGGLGRSPRPPCFRWLVAPALVFLSATGAAVPRGTGTQRNSSAAGRRRCPPTIQSTQADSWSSQSSGCALPLWPRTAPRPRHQMGTRRPPAPHNWMEHVRLGVTARRPGSEFSRCILTGRVPSLAVPSHLPAKRSRFQACASSSF